MAHSYHVTPIDPADCHRVLQLPLDVLKGIGPVRAAQLAGRGLATVEDLLYHLPFRYEDRRDVTAIGEAAAGESGAFVGRLTSLRAGRIRRGRGILTGTLTDDTGSLDLVWFNPVRFIAEALRVGQRLSVYGRVAPGRGARLNVPHPEFEVLDEGTERQPEVRPVYEKPGDVSQANLRGWAIQALDRFGDFFPSFLPPEVAGRQRLMDLRQALDILHRPSPGNGELPPSRGGGSPPDRVPEPGADDEARAAPSRSTSSSTSNWPWPCGNGNAWTVPASPRRHGRDRSPSGCGRRSRTASPAVRNGCCGRSTRTCSRRAPCAGWCKATSARARPS